MITKVPLRAAAKIAFTVTLTALAAAPAFAVAAFLLRRSDKTLDVREGLLHEVLNEVGWRPVADRFAEWILAHK